MEARETALKNLLEGKKQFAIPLYQRRYSWTEPHWRSYWNAVSRQYSLLTASDPTSKSTYFLGSLVVQPTSDHASGLSKYNVIDGQQRLVTTLVLFAVIRDAWPDPENKERVTETYLLNKWEKDDNQLKLLPGRHDRDDFKAIVLREDPAKAVGAIGEAYRWFKNQIAVLANDAKQPVDLDALERTVIGRLEVVDVTLGPSDNAHRIFQTLNSTGHGLSQVDLLRNHFFMLLPTMANEAYEDHWQPMEERLDRDMERYLWVETVSRGEERQNVPTGKVYETWQKDLAKIEDDEAAVLEVVKDLAAKAEVYKRILDPQQEPHKGVRHRLQMLNAWGSNVYAPVAFQAALKQADDPDGLAESLLYIESFMVRRMIAHTATNNLNRTFTTTVGQLVDADPKSYSQALRRTLSAPNKYWPSDAEIRKGAKTEPFYQAQRSAQRQYVLRRLEESLPGKEVPDWNASTYSVEHVMPQHATQEWLSVLQQADPETDPLASHGAVVDTLGNLTLTTQNPELSDNPLKRKQEILQTSILKMNQKINSADTWNRQTIEARSAELAEAAITVWPGPVEDLDKGCDAWREDLVGVLAFLPAGAWVATEDLAEFVDRDASEVHTFLVSSTPEGKERVLRSDGRVDTSLPWVASDINAFRGVLVSIGVLDKTTDEVANPSQHLDAEALAGLQSGSA